MCKTTLTMVSTCLLMCSMGNASAENTITVTADPVSGRKASITASKTNTSLENTPKSISVLTSSDIMDRPGSAGIQSLLAQLPGIDYARSGGLGGQIVMRGFNSNDERGIVVVDGERYRGRNTLQFNMFDPSSIERIEVIRGPASALYGSDAMTGVINIVTRRSAIDPFGTFKLIPKIRSLTYHSVSNMTQSRLELEGGGKGFDLMLGGVYSHADDYQTPKGKAVNSAFHYKGIDFNLGYHFSADRRIELQGRYHYVVSGRAGGIAGAPGYPVSAVNESPIIEKYLRVFYRDTQSGFFADNLEASLYIRDWKTDLYQTRFDKNRNIARLVRNNVYNPTIYGGHFTANKVLNNHSLAWGGDFYYDDRRASRRQISNYLNGQLTSETPLNKSSRDTTMLDVGLFINDNWQLGDNWVLDGTLRGDFVQYHISSPDFVGEDPILTRAFQGNTTQKHVQLTGSVGAIYKFTPDFQFFANFSRGFRAPTSASLVSSSVSGNAITLPAPGLKPETNINVEAGLRYFGTSDQVSLSVYQSHYTNLIAVQPINKNINQRVNVNQAVVQGIELEGKRYWSEQLISKYSLTYTRTEDKKTGYSLGYTAPLKGSLSLKYDAYNWYAEGVMQAYARKTRIDPGKERQTAGYVLFDLYAGMPLDRVLGANYADWTLSAGVENIFNKAARNPSINESIHDSRDLIGNPLYHPGRGFVIKLSGTY